MSDSDTPSSTRFEKLILDRIHIEMRAFADAQELMRREVAELKVAFGKFEGRQEGSRDSQDGVVRRVEKLEAFVDDLRMFKVKVAAYGALGGTVFGAIASAIVGLIMKGAK